MEFHHITIRVPDDRVEAWDRHLAEHFPRFQAPEGFLLVIAADPEQRGLYHMASVLGEREKVFAGQGHSWRGGARDRRGAREHEAACATAGKRVTPGRTRRAGVG